MRELTLRNEVMQAKRKLKELGPKFEKVFIEDSITASRAKMRRCLLGTEQVESVWSRQGRLFVTLSSMGKGLPAGADNNQTNRSVLARSRLSLIESTLNVLISFLHEPER